MPAPANGVFGSRHLLLASNRDKLSMWPWGWASPGQVRETRIPTLLGSPDTPGRPSKKLDFGARLVYPTYPNNLIRPQMAGIPRTAQTFRALPLPCRRRRKKCAGHRHGGAVSVDAVFLELDLQGAPADPEESRCVRSVATGLLQRADDHFPLHLPERSSRFESQLRVLRSVVEFLEAIREFPWGDDVAPRHDHRALDHVFQFPHVSMPGVPHESIHGSGAEALDMPS